MAVREAWAIERNLAKQGMERTAWNASEKAELIATGRVQGYIGHHINSVAHNSLEMARNPNNIKFVKGIERHLDEHANNCRNQTSGPLLEQLSKLSGIALVTFFTTYEAKMLEFSANCPLISTTDSWLSYINPWNYIVENAALFEAWVASENAQLEYEKEQQEESKKQRALTKEKDLIERYSVDD